MKKILLITVMLAVYAGVFAQLKIDENFLNPPFTASGSLAAQNSWAGTAGGTDVQVSYLTTNAAGTLAYPGYTSGRSYITTVNTNSRDPYKPFNSAISSTVNSTFYFSFIVNVTGSATTSATTSANHILALRTDAAGAVNQNFCYFYIADDGGTNLKFGIGKDDNVDGTYASGNFVFGTTYLIVIRYDISTATTSDDRIFMWVNTSLGTQPATSGYSPAGNTAQLTSGFDGGDTGPNPDATFTGNINALQLFQRTSGASAKFDAFKVAVGTGQATQQANADAAWANLAPQGAPLPVKLSSIKAYERQQGIQLDWTAYHEENLSGYQIERSANGIIFISIGEIAARNVATETKYGFFDANPLSGTSFYRLKNIDFDGKSGYSNVVKVNLDKSNNDISLYPNPVRGGYVSFQTSDLSKGNYSVKVFNAGGQQVYTQRFTHSGGAINQTIQLPPGIKSGMYSMQLEKEGVKVMNKAFMVQ